MKGSIFRSTMRFFRNLVLCSCLSPSSMKGPTPSPPLNPSSVINQSSLGVYVLIEFIGVMPPSKAEQLCLLLQTSLRRRLLLNLLLHFISCFHPSYEGVALISSIILIRIVEWDPYSFILVPLITDFSSFNWVLDTLLLCSKSS